MSMKQGCCNNDVGGGPDFSLVTFPQFELCSELMDLGQLWMVGVALVIGPFITSLILVFETHTGILKAVSQKLGLEPRRLYLYICLVYTGVTYISYHRVVQTLPYSPSLQTNQMLATGYALFVAGCILKTSCLFSHGWTSTVREINFYTDSCHGDGGNGKIASTKGSNDPYFHPGATSSLLVIVGHSLILARMWAIFMSFLLILSYTATYLLERYNCMRKWTSLHRTPRYLNMEKEEG